LNAKIIASVPIDLHGERWNAAVDTEPCRNEKHSEFSCATRQVPLEHTRLVVREQELRGVLQAFCIDFQKVSFAKAMNFLNFSKIFPTKSGSGVKKYL